MVRQIRLYRWRFLGTGLLLGLAIGAWLGSGWVTAEPGSSEDVFTRVRIGMSQDEAVAVLRTYAPDNIDTPYVEGVTKDGRLWAGTDIIHGAWFQNLPPSQEIAHCALGVWDTDGRKVEVILGPGGIVSHKRLSPCMWQYRLEKVEDAVARASTDLSSGLWWNDQRHKIYRSVRRRWHHIAPSLGAVLLLASVWSLRCKIVRCGPRHVQTMEPSRAKPVATDVRGRHSGSS